MASFETEKINKNPNLIYPLGPARTDICPFCRAQRIERFSFNGYPQNYKEAVNMYLKGYNISYDKYEIREMKCTSCKRVFTIDWSTGFPVPLKDTYNTTIFFQEFINGI